jgi:hypothetical protein|tara:strand:- start:1173 stop:1478 length:306 start_codon:yes stop_codon:yes gene_type:complete
MYYYCLPHQYNPSNGLTISSPAKTLGDMGKQLQRIFDVFAEKKNNAQDYQMVRVMKKSRGARSPDLIVGYYRLEDGKMIKHKTQTMTSLEFQFERMAWGRG